MITTRPAATAATKQQADATEAHDTCVLFKGLAQTSVRYVSGSCRVVALPNSDQVVSGCQGPECFGLSVSRHQAPMIPTSTRCEGCGPNKQVQALHGRLGLVIIPLIALLRLTAGIAASHAQGIRDCGGSTIFEKNAPQNAHGNR